MYGVIRWKGKEKYLMYESALTMEQLLWDIGFVFGEESLANLEVCGGDGIVAVTKRDCCRHIDTEDEDVGC